MILKNSKGFCFFKLFAEWEKIDRGGEFLPNTLNMGWVLLYVSPPVSQK